MKYKCYDMFGCQGKQIGWLRHILTSLSIFIFTVGVSLLLYISWVLATSLTLIHFFSGSLVFTYAVIGLGVLLFTTGLIGWVSSTSEKICLLRWYLAILIIAVMAQLGGIISLNVMGVEMADILKRGWSESNQAMQSLLQYKMDCCGFDGPEEFTKTNFKIHISCYTSSEDLFSERLKQDGCGIPLKLWFEANKIIWCSVLASLGGLQLMCIVLSAHIINKLKDKSLPSPSSSQRNLHPAHFM